MKNRKTVICISMILVLTGCTQELGFLRDLFPPSQTPSRTRTNTPLPSHTFTSTVTLTPTITSTIGPPPDLEITNLTIYPESFERAGQAYFLLGRMRNNTDQIMIFHGYEKVFDFEFTLWEHTSDFYFTGYHHRIYKDKFIYFRDLEEMSCLLYPNEEGIIFFRTPSIDAEEILYEEMEEHRGPLGIWFTYEGFFDTVEGIPLYYHPKTANLVFTKEPGILRFDYDIVDMPNLIDMSHVSQVISWLFLYNKDGKIINLLMKRLSEMPGLTYGGTFHIHASTKEFVYDPLKHFLSAVELTNEMIDQVDHIEVFTEFRESPYC
jgi:hypothetical protein